MAVKKIDMNPVELLEWNREDIRTQRDTELKLRDNYRDAAEKSNAMVVDLTKLLDEYNSTLKLLRSEE